MLPLVTISIPIYQCENFIEKCLESVRNQSYANIEVSLINDQTQDNSVKIAEEFIRKYQLTNWEIMHLEKNAGLSVVRNKGIDTANGKYLFFLDSDDTITPDCIEKLVKVAEENQAQLTISQTECEKLESGDKSFCIGKISDSSCIFGNDAVFSAFAVEGKITGSAVNKLFLVDFYRSRKIYFVPGLFAQDELWTFHSCLVLDAVAFHKDTTYTYYLHDQSVIHNRGKRHFDNWQTIAEYIDKALKDEKNEIRKSLILIYLIHYKSITLLMNWKAQKNKLLWMESYRNYKKLSSLSFTDYFSKYFPNKVKKMNLFNYLPTTIGFHFFKWRFER
jgi:glycosyltransferase involved in cell wall biosynthesis